MATSATRLRAFHKRHGLSQAKAGAMTRTPARTWEGYELESRQPPGALLLLLDYIDMFGPLPGDAGQSDQEGSDAR